TARGQPLALPVGTAEVPGVRQHPSQLGLAPEQHADVETSGRGTVEDIECGPAAVGQLRLVIDEGDGHPHAVAGGFDGLADATERGRAVDQRAHPVAGAERVRPRAGRRDRRHEAGSTSTRRSPSPRPHRSWTTPSLAVRGTRIGRPSHRKTKPFGYRRGGTKSSRGARPRAWERSRTGFAAAAKGGL